MPCPTCGVRVTEVKDSRATGNAVRRRRWCPNGHRFTTYETVGAAIPTSIANTVVRREADKAAKEAARMTRQAILEAAGLSE